MVGPDDHLAGLFIRKLLDAGEPEANPHARGRCLCSQMEPKVTILWSGYLQTFKESYIEPPTIHVHGASRYSKGAVYEGLFYCQWDGDTRELFGERPGSLGDPIKVILSELLQVKYLHLAKWQYSRAFWFLRANFLAFYILIFLC